MPTSKSTGNGSTQTIRRRDPLPRGFRAKIPLVALGASLFYRERGRDFPWRKESEPYKLAVAEILLQKTRAASALPVYEFTLQRFPSALDLADADVTALKETLRPIGLSQKRATQLRTMAQEIVRLGDAVFDDWRLLILHVPGLGAYAARAIACFSRGEQIGIVDANVARIFRRIFRVTTTDPRAVVYQRLADAVAAQSNDARSANFGLLDIGALICKPKPRCADCPFVGFCPRYGVF